MVRDKGYVQILKNTPFALSPAQASASSVAGTGTYEEAMQPHVHFVKKSSANVKRYYDVACSVIAGFGKRRG